MGKFGSPQIGVFSPDGNNYDDPNLNKCVNCGALFQGEVCPICKTACAPEMTAGKRKTAKKASDPVKTRKPDKALGCSIWIFITIITISVLAILFASNDSDGTSSHSTEYVPKEIDKSEYYTIYGYDTLARYPDDYKGTKVKLIGEVVQTIETEGNDWVNIRLATDNYGKKVFYCVYHKDMINGRLLEEDEVIVYGVAEGLYTYESVMGQQITIPLIYVDAIEFAN